jgi:hypothetical protein
MLNQEFMTECRHHGLTKHHAIAQCDECREIDNERREYAYQFKMLVESIMGDGGIFLCQYGANKATIEVLNRWYSMKAKGVV